MAKSKKKKISLWQEARLLFSGWSIVGWLAFLFIMHMGYVYILLKDVPISIIAGAFGSVMWFFSFTVANKKVRVYQFQLNELLKYATNMSFFMQSGKNPYYSLIETKKTLDISIQKEIDKTLSKLEEEAKLDTQHFEKYNFPALNQFHKILKIKDEKGGSAREMFGRVIKSMNFEISKRDDLHRKKKGRAQTIYMIIGMVGAMPVILNFMTANIYDQFLSVKGPATILLLLFYIVILFTCKFAQKKKNDISIRL
ncbi:MULTISPECIES: hypothetical protein [Bacillus cereus group]|uniref:hypothetical protein n=1 Tax=Bacillus cereus group TaxID=86661 RepID=UPI000C20FB0E|nr:MULTISPECIES: hypothetical protein [Bacillus cereus group]MEB9694885.1 hypothetical protein [Bacillus cereus]